MAKVLVVTLGSAIKPFPSVSGWVGVLATLRLVDNGDCWAI